MRNFISSFIVFGLSPVVPSDTCLPYLNLELSSLPPSCSCSILPGARLSLSCPNISLSSLKVVYTPGITSTVKSLNIQGSNIGSLQQRGRVFHSAGLRDLEILNIKDCGITELNSHIFQGMTLLRKLYLAHNLLEDIPPDIFAGLTLWELDLSFNRLKILNSQIFQDIGSSLRSLNLQHNSFEYLPLPNDRDPFPKLKQKSKFLLDENPWKCDCHMRNLEKLLRQKFSYEICGESELFCPPLFQKCFVSPNPWAGPNTSLALSCTVTGFPPPVAVWYHNQTRIQSQYFTLSNHERPGNTKIKTVVEVENTSWSSAGIYLCEIYNGHGKPVREFPIALSYTKETNSFASNLPVLIGISSLISLVLLVVILSVGLAVFTRYMKKQNYGTGAGNASASSSLTVLNHQGEGGYGYLGTPTAFLRCVNPLPKPPRREMAGCLSRGSTISEQSTLPDTTTLCPSRSNTEMTGMSGCSDCQDAEAGPLPPEFSELLHSNEPGARDSLRSINVYQDYADIDALSPKRTGSFVRPGYVTLPRRPRPSQPPASPFPLQDWSVLGPRTMGDGSSSGTLNRSLDYQPSQTVRDLPPFPLNSAINSLGLPPAPPSPSLSLHLEAEHGDRRAHTLSSRHCLDTIQENE